jgi:hypothetical protein
MVKMTIKFANVFGVLFIMALMFGSAFASSQSIAASDSAAAATQITAVKDSGTLGYIAYWWGKVNQHRDVSGAWQTDPDGVSGANINTLQYCQKWFPGTKTAIAGTSEMINDWRTAGNVGSYSGTGAVYQCSGSNDAASISPVQPTPIPIQPTQKPIPIEPVKQKISIAYAWNAKTSDANIIYAKVVNQNYNPVKDATVIAEISGALTGSQQMKYDSTYSYYIAKFPLLDGSDSAVKAAIKAERNGASADYSQEFMFYGKGAIAPAQAITIASIWADNDYVYAKVVDSLGNPSSAASVKLNLVYAASGASILSSYMGYDSASGYFRYATSGLVQYDTNAKASVYAASNGISAQLSNNVVIHGTGVVQPATQLSVSSIWSDRNYAYAKVVDSDGTAATPEEGTSVSLSMKWGGSSSSRVLGYISYWYGKVDQHRDVNGQWQTDPDGVSGADIYPQEYCQKWFPSSTGVNDIGNAETIPTWRNRGNMNSYGAAGVVYECTNDGRVNVVTRLVEGGNGFPQWRHICDPDMFGTVSCPNSAPIGYISYWYGKVNQHRDVNGQWQTDPDGVSGADIYPSEYCQKWFPNARGAIDLGNPELITDWRNRGNGGSYSASGNLYACITDERTSVFTPLGEWGFPNWRHICDPDMFGTTSCPNSGIVLFTGTLPTGPISNNGGGQTGGSTQVTMGYDSSSGYYRYATAGMFTTDTTVQATATASKATGSQQASLTQAITIYASGTIEPQNALAISSIWSDSSYVYAKVVDSDGSAATPSEGTQVSLAIVQMGAGNYPVFMMNYDSASGYYRYPTSGMFKEDTKVTARVNAYRENGNLQATLERAITIYGANDWPPSAPASHTLYLYAGWNMVTPPDQGFSTDSIAKSCDVRSKMWEYNGNSYQEYGVTPGHAFWVKVGSDCKVETNGNQFAQTEVKLMHAGWNQIGTPNENLKYDSAASTCNVLGGPWLYNTQGRAYKKGSLDYLEAGRGYWVKVSGECTLAFGDGMPPAPPNEYATTNSS